MLVSPVRSKNGIPIRLTEERWAHIIEEHPELNPFRTAVLETIITPERILQGGKDELLALKEIETGKWLVVIYREFEDDGFIITAFLTRRANSLNRRRQLWP